MTEAAKITAEEVILKTELTYDDKIAFMEGMQEATISQFNEMTIRASDMEALQQVVEGTKRVYAAIIEDLFRLKGLDK